MLRILSYCLIAFVASSLLLSCSWIKEDTEICQIGCVVKLTVAGTERGNIYSALKLGTDLNRLTLYIFDEDGIFIDVNEFDGEIIKTNDYTFRVLLEPGNYTFVAGIGVEAREYGLSGLIKGVSTLKDFTLKVDRDGSKSQNNKLTPLWNGYLNKVEVSAVGETEVILPMTKDTNTFIAIIQDSSGENITADEFDLKILADNGYINYDNSLLSDERLTYNAYRKESAWIDSDEEDTPVSISILRAEMNTLRLMENKSVRFVITHKDTGTKILDINLIQYLLLTREMAENEAGFWFSNQDYLDYQDVYSIIFFLNSTPGKEQPYQVLSLNINGWIVRLNNEIL